MNNRTKDGVRAIAATKVYGISPWGEIETLYVQLDQMTASTGLPTELSNADHCSFPVCECYFSEDRARSVACTYVEDEYGFMGPPSY